MMQPRLPYQLYGFQFPLDLSEPTPASTLLQRMPLFPPPAWNASSHGLVDEFIQVFAEVSSQEDLRSKIAIFSSHSPAMYPAFFVFITLNSEDKNACIFKFVYYLLQQKVKFFEVKDIALYLLEHWHLE